MGAPFLGVTQTSLGNVTFSTDGINYYTFVSIDNDPIRVNLKALNPNFGSGLTSSYNNSTGALDVAVDTTTIALKSELPAAVSGTNDGTNWTSLTIGAQTYGFASGGSSYSAGTGIDITNNTISVDNTIALKSEVPTTATSRSTLIPTVTQLAFTYDDNTTETITLMTDASVSTTTTLS